MLTHIRAHTKIIYLPQNNHKQQGKRKLCRRVSNAVAIRFGHSLGTHRPFHFPLSPIEAASWQLGHMDHPAIDLSVHPEAQ